MICHSDLESSEKMIISNEVNQETIKDANSKKILQLLCKENCLTKQEISKKLNISIPTVTHNINTLIDKGIVKESGTARSTGGRKPVVVEFLPNSRFSIGVELLNEKMRIVIINLKSEILVDKSIFIKNIYDVDKVMVIVNENINQILIEASIDKKNLLGIGFSVPGTVDEQNKVLELAPNLSYKKIEFHKYENFFDLEVYVENEANVSALAECTLGIAKEMRNLVYVSINDGVGTGIVIKDHLYKGKNNRAGEFGHMTIFPEGKECNCGKKGCWELYSSTKALLNIYNDISVNKVETVEKVFEAYLEKEEFAIKAIDEYVSYVAIGLQNIILIFDPHYIVIGGYISKYGNYIIEEIKKKVYIKNQFYKEKDNTILLSNLKGDSSVLGAALLPLQKVFYVNDKVI